MRKYQLQGGFMKRALAKALGAAGAIISAGSGLTWHLSAKAQLEATAAISESSTKAEVLTYIASQQNLQAAYLAAIAGVLLGLAIFFDD